MDPDAKRLLVTASKYSYIGIFFGVAICIGFFGGRWIDDRFHTQPWFSLVGLFIGIAAGFRELYRLAKQGMKDERNNDSA